MSEQIVSEETKDEVLTLKDFAERPFASASWEIIGGSLERRGFLPLELSVVQIQAAVDRMFESFDARKLADQERMWHLPGEDSFRGEGLIEESKILESRIVQELIETVRSEAFAEGYKKGSRETEEEAAKEREVLTTRLDELSKQMNLKLQEFFINVESNALDLALVVARKVLLLTAECKPEYILEVIREGLKHLGAAKPLRIRLSPDDYEFVQVVGVPADLSREELGVVYVSDESIKAGCVIETDFGELDLELNHMWEQVKEGLSEGSK